MREEYYLILECISFSKILDIDESREIGQYEETSFGDFFGFNMGTMMACFHKGVKILYSQAWL